MSTLPVDTKRNQRSCCLSLAEVWDGPIHEYIVSILRTAKGSDQGPVLEERWIHTSVQLLERGAYQ